MERRNGLRYLQEFWGRTFPPKLKFDYTFKLSSYAVKHSVILSDLVFTRSNTGHGVIYTHSTHHYYSMPETVEHRKIRFKGVQEEGENAIDVISVNTVGS